MKPIRTIHFLTCRSRSPADERYRRQSSRSLSARAIALRYETQRLEGSAGRIAATDLLYGPEGPLIKAW
jgi:hypothetical protein